MIYINLTAARHEAIENSYLTQRQIEKKKKRESARAKNERVRAPGIEMQITLSLSLTLCKQLVKNSSSLLFLFAIIL